MEKKFELNGRTFGEIPNPLNDMGVQKDIREKVEEILKYPGRQRNINDLIKDLVTRAAEWGISTGFHMGWKVYEVTEGGKR